MLPSAAALNQVMWNTAAIVGPAVGGIVVSRVGLVVGVRHRRRDLRRRARLRVPAPPAAPAPRAGRRSSAGWAAVASRVPLPQGQAHPPVDVHGRHRRDGVRDAARAVPGPRPGAVRPAAPKPSAGCSAQSRWARSLGALASGWVSRVRRQGLAVLVAVTIWGIGIIAFGLAGDRLVLAVVVPRGRRRRRRHLRGLPLDDPTADGAGRAARTLDVVQHPRRRRWTRGSATSRRAWLRPRSHRPRRSSPAACCASPVSAAIATLVPRFARWTPGDPP